jgi:hypothetical protein
MMASEIMHSAESFAGAGGSAEIEPWIQLMNPELEDSLFTAPGTCTTEVSTCSTSI